MNNLATVPLVELPGEERCLRARHAMQARVAMLTLFLAFPAFVTGASFRGLGDLPGGDTESEALDVSANGSAVVGYSYSASGQEAFLWTEEAGMVGLGDLPGGDFGSAALGVSGDGLVVTGTSHSAESGSTIEAFLWTAETGMVGLGDLPGGDYESVASRSSTDGSIIVGAGAGEPQQYPYISEAFRWTEATGMVGLGDLDPGGYSGLRDVSADGSVGAGWGASSNGIEAVRWSAGDGMVALGQLSGHQSTATGISADGEVVVGYSSSQIGEEAFVWTEASGMVGLGDLPLGVGSSAWGVSGNGRVVVGWSLIPGDFEPVIWDETGESASSRRALGPRTWSSA